MIDQVWNFISVSSAIAPPDEAQHAARRSSVDYLGLALAGSSTDEAAVVRAAVALEGEGPCLVIGTEQRAAAQGAAFANAAAAHSLGLDDFSASARGHVTTVVLSAAVAAAQLLGKTDAELLDAYIVGYEVECAIGSIVSVEQYDRGWHPTATIGIFGATAAAARLWGLSPNQVEAAFGVAAALSSGIRGSIGTALKAIQVGQAASKGVLAAEVAAAGLSGVARALHSEHSFFALATGRQDIDWSRLETLGKTWDLLEAGPRFVLAKGGDRHVLDDQQVLRRFIEITADRVSPETLETTSEWLSGSGRYLQTLATLSS